MDYAFLNNAISKPKDVSPITSNRIKRQLKSEFATYLFNQESRYFLSMDEDNDVQKAILEFKESL